LKQTVYLIK